MRFLPKIFFTGFLIFSCSRELAEMPELNISFSISKYYCWLNLMPGSKPSFHFTIEGEVLNKEKEKIGPLVRASIVQDDKYLFRFNPEVIFLDNVNNGIEPGMKTSVDLNGRTDSVITELESGKFISIRLDFIALEKRRVIIIDSVKIEKAF
jgi:hypothetical protein